ncbi:unnamed protein product [Somion occarium]|uniref:Uncharacterized protein n=1 Tax=Somion occarium TaxID=3059160 RepID=A0ABP1DQV8_9APHY
MHFSSAVVLAVVAASSLPAYSIPVERDVPFSDIEARGFSEFVQGVGDKIEGAAHKLKDFFHHSSSTTTPAPAPAPTATFLPSDPSDIPVDPTTDFPADPSGNFPVDPSLDPSLDPSVAPSRRDLEARRRRTGGASSGSRFSGQDIADIFGTVGTVASTGINAAQQAQQNQLLTDQLVPLNAQGLPDGSLVRRFFEELEARRVRTGGRTGSRFSGQDIAQIFGTVGDVVNTGVNAAQQAQQNQILASQVAAQNVAPVARRGLEARLFRTRPSTSSSGSRGQHIADIVGTIGTVVGTGINAAQQHEQNQLIQQQLAAQQAQNAAIAAQQAQLFTPPPVDPSVTDPSVSDPTATAPTATDPATTDPATTTDTPARRWLQARAARTSGSSGSRLGHVADILSTVGGVVNTGINAFTQAQQNQLLAAQNAQFGGGFNTFGTGALPQTFVRRDLDELD